MTINLPSQTFGDNNGTNPLPKPSRAAREKVKAEKRAGIESIKREADKAAKPKRAPIGPRLRALILERDEFRCKRCGAEAATGSTLVIDHIVPVAQGGTNCESNLQTLCFECNSGKGARREPIPPDRIVEQLAVLVGKKTKAKKGGV